MTDYMELVNALRHCSHDGLVNCNECKYGGKEWPIGCEEEMMADAADAIEALLKENKELIEDHPEMVEADGHWEWRKPNGEVQLPKRGEWIWENYCWHCSACGENPTRGMGYVQGKNELFRVCPNCGADMRAKMEVQE